MHQISIFEVEQQPITNPASKIYSPGELREQGIAWTKKDAERWESEVWKIYQREWSQGNKVNWFRAIEIYRAERDKE